METSHSTLTTPSTLTTVYLYNQWFRNNQFCGLDLTKVKKATWEKIINLIKNDCHPPTEVYGD